MTGLRLQLWTRRQPRGERVGVDGDQMAHRCAGRRVGGDAVDIQDDHRVIEPGTEAAVIAVPAGVRDVLQRDYGLARPDPGRLCLRYGQGAYRQPGRQARTAAAWTRTDRRWDRVWSRERLRYGRGHARLVAARAG